MRFRGKGFTLIEMVIVLSLFSVALIALFSLTTPLLNAQLSSSRGLTAQAEALIGLRSLTRELEQASEVYLPAANPSGSAGDALSGCQNFSSAKGSGPDGMLDAALPARAFFYCVGPDSGLYEYTLDGAPPACPITPPVCGKGSAARIANRVSHSTGHDHYFVRPANSQNVIEVHYQVTGTGTAKTIDSSISIQSAAGTNQ